MFQYVKDYEGVQKSKKSYRTVKQNKAKGLIKLVGYIFSFVSHIAENAIVISLAIENEDYIYKMAYLVKNSFALCKCLCDILYGLVILYTCYMETLSAISKYFNNGDETEKSSLIEETFAIWRTPENYKAGYNFLASSLRLFSIFITFGLLLQGQKLLACLLEMARHIVTLVKNLTYPE